MSKFKENKFLFLIIAVAFVLFFAVAFYTITSNKTVKAVVLNQNASAGDVVTKDMVKTIEVSADTPEGFYTDPASAIGGRLSTSVSANQLLYESNFTSTWIDYTNTDKIPEDYAITSVCIPDERAVGGIISAGDYVDVLLVSEFDNGSYSGETSNVEINGTGRSDTGTNVSYVLSNVLVLSTNSTSTLNETDGDNSKSNSESASNDNSGGGAYYVFALSYDDLKKLRQAEGTDGKLWLNICPSQNLEKDPLLNQMVGNSYSYLHDAQKPVQDKDGKMLTDKYYQSSGSPAAPSNASNSGDSTGAEDKKKQN